MTLLFYGASISRGNGEFLSKDRHFDLTEHSRHACALSLLGFC